MGWAYSLVLTVTTVSMFIFCIVYSEGNKQVQSDLRTVLRLSTDSVLPTTAEDIARWVGNYQKSGNTTQSGTRRQNCSFGNTGE